MTNIEHTLKTSKFAFRACLTLMLMGIGAGIFFSSDDASSLKTVGSGMIMTAWASWIPTGSTQLKRPLLPTTTSTTTSTTKDTKAPNIELPEE